MKPSFWCCSECKRSILHGEYRYNCTVCPDYNLCETCVKWLHANKPHPHPQVRELAFGEGEMNIGSGQSMAETISAVMRTFQDRPCLGTREVDEKNPNEYLMFYTWLTYKTIWERVQRFANGLRSRISSREYLGICAENRPEWVIADLACIMNSIISVPIYCRMSDRDTAFVINNTKILTLVCDKEMLPKFLQLRSQCPSLRQIICMDPVSGLNENNLPIHYMNDIENEGSSQDFEYKKTNPTDCLTIIYTSGSSGFPKGVIISDRAYRMIFQDPSPMARESIIMLYQPLAWYGGRNGLTSALFSGGRIGFSTGNIDRLMEELAIVRPTIFPAPPSIWNKIYSEFKTALALKTKTSNNPQEIAQIEENLLQQFSKLIPARCQTIAIVGALISSDVFDFLKRCFRHCQIIDAYGITECGGVAFGNYLDPKIAYRVESVPEMGFTINDKPFPRGELLTKTPQMFSGYVNNPAETEAALTKDGFFRTGDIIELRPVANGPPEIRIIDRKKNFFKLSHGQFVSPEYLQGVFTQSSFIDQVYIHADLHEDCILAVVVPNRERVQAFAQENNIQVIESDPKLNDAIIRELKLFGTKASLQTHEIPSQIIIDFEPFTVENGLLTLSMKQCRPKLAAHYKDRLESKNSIEKRLKDIIENATGQTLTTSDSNEFLIAGGNSLTALRLSRLIENDLGITIPVNVLFEPDMNLKRLVDFAKNPSVSQNDSFVSRLIRDAELELNITVGKPKDTYHQLSRIFVTGVTGFVGGFLLFELLKKYPMSTKCICLVRCESSQNPLDRIQKNLEFLRLWQETFRERIIAVCGDLSQRQFGLDNKTYMNLTTETGLIFHCGATVNFVLPYSQLYGPNVCGTQEIIRFATAATSSCIPIQYISTISVLPPGITNEVSIDEISPDRLNNGYGQSKWVAEKLVAKAIRSGLPIAIYRLGSMCCDSRTGACNPLDIYTIFLENLIKIRSYPWEIYYNLLNTLPIDFAVTSIVNLSQSRQDVYGKVYHVVHPTGGIPLKDVLHGIAFSGINLGGVPMTEWRARIKEQTKNNSSSELFGEFIINALLNTQQYTLSSQKFYSIIPQQNIPVMDFEYARKWSAFIQENILTR